MCDSSSKIGPSERKKVIKSFSKEANFPEHKIGESFFARRKFLFFALMEKVNSDLGEERIFLKMGPDSKIEMIHFW